MLNVRPGPFSRSLSPLFGFRIRRCFSRFPFRRLHRPAGTLLGPSRAPAAAPGRTVTGGLLPGEVVSEILFQAFIMDEVLRRVVFGGVALSQAPPLSTKRRQSKFPFLPSFPEQRAGGQALLASVRRLS